MNEIPEPQLPILTSDQRLRVFISSTLHEMGAERVAVRDALVSLRLHPVMFETGAKPYPPRAVYRAFLEQSHIYVGIFGESYGWVSPDMEISGLEDEYNLSSNKRRLLYVKAPAARQARLGELLKRIEQEAQVCYKSFSTPEELAELVKADVAQLLSETFQLAGPPLVKGAPPVPTYLAELQRDMKSRGIIQRSQITSNLHDAIANTQLLIVTGDPGVGKTYVLGTVGAEIDAIYISVRNKSIQHVFSHLANHLALRRHRVPENLPSESDAKSALQEEMSNGQAVLIIDDADQNPTVLKALMDLHTYSCRFVIASRHTATSVFDNIRRFLVEGFSREEISTFLELHNVSLGSGEMAELASASGGNPLYLYYFVSNRVVPNPRGLDDYQQTLWHSLTPIQQDVLNLVAHAYVGLDTPSIHELLVGGRVDLSPLTQTRQILDALHPLLRLVAGHYEIFHPYFAEYIRSLAHDDGCAVHYHARLGDLAAGRSWDAAAAYHFLHAENPKSKLYLLSGGSDAMLRGDWPLAVDLLESLLQQTPSDDKHAQAYVRYLLAQTYFELGRNAEARSFVDGSERLFREIGDTAWAATIGIWSATLLIEERRTGEAIKLLEKAIESYEGTDKWREAAARLNIALCHIRVSQFREGAAAAERALALFTELKDVQGINTAILNLSACVSSLGDLDLAEKYANEIVEKARRHQLWRLECGGLNHLAGVQRRRQNPIGAQQSLERCIAIARKVGTVEVEALNLANLGNALRDQEKYGPAENAYLESLTLARKHRLRRQEGHALELLGKLKRNMGLTLEGVTMLRDALTIHLEGGEHVRIASTYEDLALAYEKSAQMKDAAAANEKAGEHYRNAGLWSEAGYRWGGASVQWCALGEAERALDCASRALDSMVMVGDPECGRRLVAGLTESEPRAKFVEYYLGLADLVYRKSTFPLVHLIERIAAYTRAGLDKEQRKGMQRAIGFLVEATRNSPDARLLNALAVCFEQADLNLCSAEELRSHWETLCEKMDISFQDFLDGPMVWTIGIDWKEPLVVQIIAIDDDPLLRRIAASLVLILRSSEKALGDAVSQNGGNRESGFSLSLLTEKSAREELQMHLSKYEIPEPVSATLLSSNVPWGEPQPPSCLIIHADYEKESNCALKPDNKALLWILMSVLGALVSHCSHVDSDAPELRKQISQICTTILPFQHQAR